MGQQGPMNPEAPAFPRATGAIDPVRAIFEKAGTDDLSPLWSGEAAALAREEDAGVLTRRLWNDACDLARGLSGTLPGLPGCDI